MAEPKHQSPASRRVVRLKEDQADEFLDLIESTGVIFPDGSRAKNRHHYGTETFRCYVGYNDRDEAAAIATMYVSTKSNTGFLANTYTYPEFRRQGFHSSLLVARIHEAADLGLNLVFTDVEPASQSQRNCEHTGFKILTASAIWEKV